MGNSITFLRMAVKQTAPNATQKPPPFGLYVGVGVWQAPPLGREYHLPIQDYQCRSCTIGRLWRSQTGSSLTMKALPILKGCSFKSGPLKVLVRELQVAEVSRVMCHVMDEKLPDYPLLANCRVYGPRRIGRLMSFSSENETGVDPNGGPVFWEHRSQGISLAKTYRLGTTARIEVLPFSIKVML